MLNFSRNTSVTPVFLAGHQHSAKQLAHRFFTILGLLVLSSCFNPPEKPPLIGSNSASDNNPPQSRLCKSTVTAEVVALEQIITFNRFGAFNPAGMVYALKQDVVYDDPDTKVEEQLPLPDNSKLSNLEFTTKIAGWVKLRSDKRPRPLVLRVHEDECLQVTFWNLLSPLPSVHTLLKREDFKAGGVVRHAVQETPVGDLKATDISTPPRCFDKEGNANPNNASENCKNLFPFPRQEEPDYPSTRAASIHVNGLDYVNIGADGANVGKNPSSLVEPGESTTYVWYGRQEGGYFMYSAGALAGGEGDGGQLGLGLFGSVNVEPKGSIWYRSQVTHQDMVDAADSNGDYSKITYEKLAILDGDEIVHSDLNAIIFQENTKDDKGNLWESRSFDKDGKAIPGTGLDCSKLSPGSSCGMSFREFTTIFHDENKVFQAFAELSDEGNPISAISDGMAINYGASGVGSAVLAAKKHIGPGKDCPECKLEEFFLSSWVNGDPAMIVQRNMDGKAVKALYPDDPSNVHHSYLGDPVRFRNIHAGPKETHVFHLHAHQWLQDKNDPNANYLDSQTISPGSSYTYDIQYGGGGNRNLTVGDAIFHCHLYPHFAAGMWELWRNHDVFEDGTPGLFDESNNPGGRYLPDFEIKTGTPNPAIVPIPYFPHAPAPNKEVRGYPFFMAAVPGHRPPQPPLDMARGGTNQEIELNGGLPRHVIVGGSIKLPEDKEMQPEELLKGQGDPLATNASRYIAERTWKLNSDPNNLGLAQKLAWASIKIAPQCGSKEEILAMAYHAGWSKNDLMNLKKGINETKDEKGNKTTLMPPWCTLEVQQTLAGLDNNFTWQQSIPDVSWPKKTYNGQPMKPLWKGKGYEDSSVADNSAGSNYDPGKYFRINGYKPRQGAPFAEPCPATYFKKIDESNHQEALEETGVNIEHPRLYKSAYIQFDLTVNKYGWHDPQARMPVLEEDAAATINGDRLAEPLFFRATSGDCIQFQATNLIPGVLNLDDFQVYTPTDTIGQHIHLVKFDVTSSDGSANGWNYEDGTFAPDEVRERIEASKHGSVIKWDKQPYKNLEWADYKLPKGTAHTDILGKCSGSAKDNNKNHPWCGAQATVQRWWADPVLNDQWDDRTMRAVFTHDHYGPSSHQQHGFYAALVVEREGTVWTKLSASPADVDLSQDKCEETTLSGSAEKPCRPDGGPTSFAANIGLPKNHPHAGDAEHQHEIRREYNLAFADFAILYNADLRPVNPPSRQADLMLPDVVRDGLKPKPEGISTEDPGTRLLNYRNEPIPLRIAAEDKGSLEYHQKRDKYCKIAPDGDMANVFSSLAHSSPTLASTSDRITKLKANVPHEIFDEGWLAELLAQQIKNTNTFTSLLDENEPWRVDGDPSTPVLPGYAGDSLNIHLIQGAQEEQHVFSANGLKWKAEPASKNSGYMNGQQIGISEHFEMEVKLPNADMLTDYWFGSPSVENFWDGMWGLVRAMGGQKMFLPEKIQQATVAGQNAAEDPNRVDRKQRLKKLFNYVDQGGKAININDKDKADKVLDALAVLPKNLDKTVKDIPDLQQLPEDDLKLDALNSNRLSKKLLERFANDKAKRDKIISLLNTKKETGVWKDIYEVYDDLNKKFNDMLDTEGGSKDLAIIEDSYRRIFNEEVWNMQPCPFSDYAESNKHMKHVVAVMAEDILDGKKINYNGQFNITDRQGIVFIELDREWVTEQQSKAKNAQTADPEGYAKEPAEGNSYPLPAQEIIQKLIADYKNGRHLEPLVLRAKAGECIQVALHNLLPEGFSNGVDNTEDGINFWSYNLMPPIVSGFNFNQVQMSSTVNLIPQLVAYDVKEMGGGNIGLNKAFNPESKTKGLPGCRKVMGNGKADFSGCDNNITEYIWYAGNRQVIDIDTFEKYDKNQQTLECPVKDQIGKEKDKDENAIITGYVCYTPIEFGVASLRSFGDVIKQSSHGAVGALVIEPEGASVSFPDSSSRITADVKWKDKEGKDKSFREFVTVFQDDLSLHQNGQPMPNHRMADDAEDTGQKGFNYRTEPLWARNGVGTSGADFNVLNGLDYRNTLSSILPNPGCGAKPNSACGDPATPVFKAKAGSDIRFRLVHPNGHSRQHAFVLHGHNWDYQPWKNDSTEIATPDEKEIRTARLGAIGGIGPGRHFNIVTTAGGVNKVPGDYLFRVQENFQFHGGMWGILRVE
ncbi:MAG: hypothetical protein ABL903_07520 [Methylococcales bacterium]